MPHEVMGSPVVSADDDAPLLFLGSKFGNLIAIDARTGERRWQRMAGNWIDNSACIGELDDRKVVYVGSHDYNVYAFEAATGELLWKRALGGEVHSAPCFFNLQGKPTVGVASLDNHVYALDAATGEIITSFFSGTPLWDKVAKGETLWGSPAAIEAAGDTVLVYGSFNDYVYVLPLSGECSLRAMARSTSSLWLSLLLVFVVFCGVVLPIVLRIPSRGRTGEGA
jgi:outer membrane protein assembly factor BamB